MMHVLNIIRPIRCFYGYPCLRWILFGNSGLDRTDTSGIDGPFSSITECVIARGEFLWAGDITFFICLKFSLATLLPHQCAFLFGMNVYSARVAVQEQNVSGVVEHPEF